MHSPERRVLVLYGTETGNSQDYAEMAAKKCQRLRFKAVVRAMDECTVGDLVAESTIIVLCSTTGQGELPRNALKLWKQLLRKKLPPTLLSHIHFTTFGLGDSSYPRYNWAIRKIHKRLEQLGCREFTTRGEGDEQHSEGADAHFEEWLNTMSAKLLEMYPLPNKIEPILESELLPTRFEMSVLPASSKHHQQQRSAAEESAAALTRSNVTLGKVSSNERITSNDHFQDVRHLIFKSNEHDESAPPYSPGDAIALYPSNNAEEVDLLIKHQEWQDIADLPVTVNDEFKDCVPGGLIEGLTLRSLLTHHLDISAIPRRSFFAGAWHFATDEREQERLQEFSTLEGLQDLFDYANRPRRSILETILEFDSLRIPKEYILDIIPLLRPRLFSIASSGVQDSKTFELAIAIVKYRTIIRRIRRGVCTRWIESLKPGDTIPFTLHKSSFPQNLDRPIIMVAPGTGVAPMRSLIKTRNALETPHPMMLFFGSRFETKDYLFGSEWPNFPELQVVCAFSRDGGGYVQDQLFKQKEKVADWIVNQNATVYICGSSGAMPRQVRITLVDIVSSQFKSSSTLGSVGLSSASPSAAASTVSLVASSPQPEPTSAEAAAEDYVRRMELTGRYLQETWS